MARFKPLRDDQGFLLPPLLSDFVPEGHLARLVSAVVDDMDTSAIEGKYSERGQRTYHPKILLKLLFYGYAVGLRSGRKIAAACETDTAFMYLAQMHRPDFRTVNDFRKNNSQEIASLFSSILAVGLELGMDRVGLIAVDSTRSRQRPRSSAPATGPAMSACGPSSRTGPRPSWPKRPLPTRRRTAPSGMSGETNSRPSSAGPRT